MRKGFDIVSVDNMGEEEIGYTMEPPFMVFASSEMVTLQVETSNLFET